MQNTLIKSFDNRTQWLIALFGFLIAFPLIDIPLIGISFSFPLFIWFCMRVSRNYKRPLFALSGKLDVLMLLFVVAAGLSILFAPPTDRGGFDLVIKDIKNFFYLAYWFCVYLFFRRWYEYIDLPRLSLCILFGIFLLTAIVIVGVRVGEAFILAPFFLTQNTYAFNTVACMGVGAIYILARFGWRMVAIYGTAMIYPMLLSESRSGSIIMILQCIVIITMTILSNSRKLRAFLIIGVLIILSFLVLIGNSSNFESDLSHSIASLVEPYNPELATLLRDRENVLKRDKSWLIRKTQVEKGVNLFMDHPVSGIGWGHFTFVRGEIELSKYVYLNREYDAYALIRSSHNSYIQVLAETGLIGFIPFLIIQSYIIWKTLNLFIKSRSIINVAPLAVSLLGIAIYFWSVSAISGAVWYFVLGLFGGAIASQHRRVI